MDEALLELPKLYKGRLLERPNRFLGIIQLETGQRIRSFRSCVVFIIQHPDAKVFSPNEKTNPLFAREFYRALSNGVEIYPYKCSITTEVISINESISIGQLS